MYVCVCVCVRVCVVILVVKFIEGSLNDSFSHLEFPKSEEDSQSLKPAVLVLNICNFVTSSGDKTRCLSQKFKHLASVLIASEQGNPLHILGNPQYEKMLLGFLF